MGPLFGACHPRSDLGWYACYERTRERAAPPHRCEGGDLVREGRGGQGFRKEARAAQPWPVSFTTRGWPGLMVT